MNSFVEEWDVFKKWCPFYVMEMINDAYIDYDDYIKIIRMMNCLGFKGLSEFFLNERYCCQKEKTQKIIKKERVADKYNEKEFVKDFIANIQSENLKNIFLKTIMLEN